MTNQYESFINCLVCGKSIKVILQPNHELEEKFSEFTNLINNLLKIDNGEQFEGESRCDCGAVMFATLNISNVTNLKKAKKRGGG